MSIETSGIATGHGQYSCQGQFATGAGAQAPLRDTLPPCSASPSETVITTLGFSLRNSPVR